MPNSRPDFQTTGMAGEFLTVGKLFKRGYQAAVTFGNAKGIDVLVHNPSTDHTFAVQVKTLRGKNCFPIRKESLKTEHVYVFIVLNKFEAAEDFFIVPGKDILAEIDKFFGSSYRNPEKQSSMPAINYGPLKPYKDNWSIFDQPRNTAAVEV
ncbi:MAG: hypothetical protein ACXV99_14625 [Candidatus Angelobacter sp.]